MELLIISLLVVLIIRTFLPSKDQSRLETLVREELSNNRKEFSQDLKNLNDSLFQQISKLTQMNEQKLEKVRDVVESNLKSLQQDNTNQLEKMRVTVDEKLHATLEKRLGESFKIVSERLEKVHAGLGEMQTLASGVGDLKKVLTNVKAKGTLGEIQLEVLLDQILSPDQYEKNYVTKEGSRDAVEFVIKLPGNGNDHVYLPIDSKFPTVNYERLLSAQDQGEKDMIDEMTKALCLQIKQEARKIKEKYIEPPITTDFGIMFLPFEGLYAEILRQPGLFEQLRQEYKIIIVGPTTIAALLNSLQMGFRTLAVQKRASEVWNVLGTVKTEFGKFGEVLDATKRKLDQASKEIDKAAVRSRAIERNLRDVQELPSNKKNDLLEPSDE